MRDDRCSLMAAGVAFYGFLSLAPALAAAVSIYGLVADPAKVDEHVRTAFAVFPDDARQLLVSQLSSVADAKPGSLTASLVAALVVGLWSASRGVRHLMEAVGLAYGVGAGGTIRRRLEAFGFTSGAVVLAGGAASAVAVLGADASAGPVRWALRLGATVAFAALARLGLERLYRLSAARGGHRRTPSSRASKLALGLLALVTVGMNVYVASFGSYNATYGALAGVVVLLLWLHLAALIVVFGAYLDADGSIADRDAGS